MLTCTLASTVLGWKRGADPADGAQDDPRMHLTREKVCIGDHIECLTADVEF